ncbi:MAG: hypothetical protein KC502_14845 [Myxococcales bacterium]|nr:hypothetical protein [Myxococcales bacterium]
MIELPAEIASLTWRSPTWMRALCALLLVGGISGCGSEEAAPTSDSQGAGVQDAANNDGALLDAALGDGEALDSGNADVATQDAGAPDTSVGLVCPGAPGCACEDESDCDDGNPCTIDGGCDSGACQGKALKSCDDGVGCTEDTCDAADGCMHTARKGPCQDGNPCTVGDACDGISCQAGKPAACNDGNGCTDDACTPGIGCTFSHNESVCVDENACAKPGVCSFSQCVPGAIKPCSDKNACTYSVCDPNTGCAHVNLPSEVTCTGGEIRDGRCYMAFKESKGIDWLAARASCNAWGGELATIHSKQANTVVRKQANAVCGAKTDVWIGLNDRMREYFRRWGDNSAVDYQNWGKSEPNNAGNEDVVSMRADGMWNDRSDDPKKGKVPCWVCSRRLPVPCTAGGKGCQSGATCAAGACDGANAKPASCDDANECTADSCNKTTCGNVALPKGATCTGGACAGAVCTAPEAAPNTAPTSCKALLAADSAATSGVRWLQPAGLAAPVSAHCDQDHGGGWTLVMKTAGKNKDFAFEGKNWAAKPKGPTLSPGPQVGEAVLPTYWTVPVTEVRLVMLHKKVTRAVVLPAKGASLHAVIQSKKGLETDIGLPQWKQLLTDASLQRSCHAEGISAGQLSKIARVRIGILGNNENDCVTSDSWLGMGANDLICGGKKAVFSGNVACYGADKGNRTTAAATWVYVR